MDASTKESNLKAAAVVLDIQKSQKISIGTAKHWSVHVAELIATYYAVEVVESMYSGNGHEPTSQDRTFAIVSDSKSALQEIVNPLKESGHQDNTKYIAS